MRSFTKVSLAILLLATLAWASEPWRGKHYENWNRNDVAKVLDHSPWAKVTRVRDTWIKGMIVVRTTQEVHVTVPAGAPPGGPPFSLPPGSPVPEGSMPQGLVPQAVFEAQWVSARTMREALARQQQLAGKMTRSGAEQLVSRAPAEYQIAVFGPDMTPFAKLGEAALAKESYLRLGGAKTSLTPSSVQILRTSDGKGVAVIIFSFPKMAHGKPTIAPNEKRLDLICETKIVVLKFHFDPRKMKTPHGRDL